MMNKERITEQSALLQQRYGNQRKPDNIIWNSQIEAILNHRSVRNYLPDELPDGAIETMIAAAQSASVSGNLHQWSVVAVTDKVLKAKLAEITRLSDEAQGNYYIEQAPVLLLWIADLSRNNFISKSEGGKAEIHNYLDSFLMSSIDTALAAQTAAIAAESIGLGIVYLGAMRNQAKEIADAIGLPDYSYVAFGMVVGHPDPNFNSVIRPRPVQEVVLHYNRYDAKRSMKELETYEESFQSFRSEAQMKNKQWSTMVADVADSFSYMGGREQLRCAVEERGFKLK
ncbi:nitroreductase family protein [Pedobacter sp. AW31-3R]|uniref:nitroreductase family protein n=1 Tax=Pedobacter sp. AW31-3R TaxID=3445781 RepID=UPI003FA09194